MSFLEWLIKWRIPPEAMQDLIASCVYLGPSEDDTPEGIVQREVRLEAARLGKFLFRNNRGAGRIDDGRFIRWGLANDSKKVGDNWKSADLIGLETMFVSMEMVLEAIAQGLPGYKVGRFLSVEVKRGDWNGKCATVEELAQLKWATFVNNAGGRALITNRTGDL